MKKFKPTEEKKRVVLDTNVIISAAISPSGIPAQAYELFVFGIIENYISDETISEIIKVFRRPKILKVVDKENIKVIINQILELSIKVDTGIKLEIIKEDKTDNKFLEVALISNADYIISGDKHLKTLKKFGNTKIISPKEFIEDIKKF